MTNSAQPAQFARPGLDPALGQPVLVADGAMGTMLQASDVSLGDFDGHEGCSVTLTEDCQLVPEQSTDALITFHPEARYFSA